MNVRHEYRALEPFIEFPMQLSPESGANSDSRAGVQTFEGRELQFFFCSLMGIDLRLVESNGHTSS